MQSFDKDGATVWIALRMRDGGFAMLRDKFDPPRQRPGLRPSWHRDACRLMNPNHYLAVAINYLFQHRPLWAKTWLSVKRAGLFRDD